MLNEFIRRIEKATKPKHLKKIEQDARLHYGSLEKNYFYILNLCYEKLAKLEDN